MRKPKVAKSGETGLGICSAKLVRPYMTPRGGLGQVSRRRFDGGQGGDRPRLQDEKLTCLAQAHSISIGWP